MLKEHYEQMKPSLKTILLSLRFGNRGDEFDSTLEKARSSVAESPTPNAFSPETKGDSHPGRKRPRRTSTTES
jgi:hypothetical protein